ncbi:MAG: hypothetical protein HW407_2070 [Bacteroidetes bacterium]|nr:hypothetical protein [Bacteroidota bacterium]
MRRFLLVLIAGILAGGCEEKIKPAVVAINPTEIPSQESWNSTVTFTDSAKIKAVLWAGHIASYRTQQFTLHTPV